MILRGAARFSWHSGPGGIRPKTGSGENAFRGGRTKSGDDNEKKICREILMRSPRPRAEDDTKTGVRRKTLYTVKHPVRISVAAAPPVAEDGRVRPGRDGWGHVSDWRGDAGEVLNET